MNKLAWGIISTGRIAKRFARGLAVSKTGELIGVASRTQEAADAFGNEFNVPRSYGSYEELLADPDIQAVYIGTPHPMHAEWAVKAAEAGKHILCEKPMTMNWAEAMSVVEAARRNDVFLMEAFMYRCNPQTAKIVELIRDKVIGDVKIIQATFSIMAGNDPKSRIMSNELGGGGILDVGCYCASMSRLVAGTALGLPFADPTEVKGFGVLNECCGTDEYAVAVLKFPGDILAQLSCGIHLNQENVVRIFGTEGNIFIPSPWIVGEQSKIIVNRNGQEPQEIEIQSSDLFGIEADVVAACIENRQAAPPAMTWDDTLGNMKTLDRWRLEIGLIYNSETRETLLQSMPTDR